MNSLIGVPILVLSLTLALPASAAAIPLLQLDAATQSRLGVTTAPLPAASRAPRVKGYARALDVVPLATLDADISVAVAALAASGADAERNRMLNAADQTVSRRVAEAATAQARADRARLELLRRRLGLEWGPAIQALSDVRRGRLISDMAQGRATLVRIDSVEGVSQIRGEAMIDLGRGETARAVILGPARLGDPQLQTTGLLAVISGPQALRLGVGASAPALLTAGSTRTGVILPRSALLRTAGQTFVYLRRDAKTFERRPVAGGISDPAGLFVAAGFRPAEQVVVRGAGQLFAAETPSREAQ